MTTPPERPQAKRLTVKEYAAWYRVTQRTVYRWVADRAVPVVRVGPRRCIRILRVDPEDATTSDND